HSRHRARGADAHGRDPDRQSGPVWSQRRGGGGMSVTGVAGEERHDLTKAESRQIRARSMRLLGSLVSAMKARIALTAAVIIVSTGAQVVGPALIAFGIDRGLPAVIGGDATPLVIVVAAYL